MEEGLSTPQFWLATTLVIYSVLGGLLQKSAFDHRRQGESARAIRLVRSATGLLVQDLLHTFKPPCAVSNPERPILCPRATGIITMMLGQKNGMNTGVIENVQCWL